MKTALFSTNNFFRLNVDGLIVYFPYDYIYPEQYEYMLALKRGIDAKGHCLIEMPSGTGKTATILSLVVAYMIENPQAVRKLIYCSRTVPEIEKVVEELKGLMAYYEKHAEVKPNMTGVVLSSRKNMCIHPVVRKEREGKVVDAKCFSMTANHIRERAPFDDSIESCQYYEGFAMEGNETFIPPGIYNLDDIKAYGMERNWCPYFLTRFTASHTKQSQSVELKKR